MAKRTNTDVPEFYNEADVRQIIRLLGTSKRNTILSTMDERQRNHLLEKCFQPNRTEENSPNYRMVFEPKNLPIIFDRIVFKYYHMGSIIAIIYMFLTVTLLYGMKMRKELKMTKFATCWYAILCILNTLTLTRIVPHVLFTMERHGFYVSLCSDTTFLCDIVSTFWASFFPFLKILELGDIFISALQKRRVTLFVWTHHFLAVIGSWYMYPYYPAIGLWYIVTISIPHIFMYAYLFFKELNIRGSRAIPTIILSVELVTQFLGSVISTIGYYFSINGKTCILPSTFLSVINAMWIVCVVLCSIFLYRQYKRYWRPNSRNITITKL